MNQSQRVAVPVAVDLAAADVVGGADDADDGILPDGDVDLVESLLTVIADRKVAKLEVC